MHVRTLFVLFDALTHATRSRPHMIIAFCLMYQLGDKADGIPLTNAGCLKVSVTVTGARTRAIEAQRAVAYTFSMVHFFLEVQGRRE